MDAVTLYPFHAACVGAGLKTFETRDWPTEHRGPLAIHAAETAVVPPEYRAWCIAMITLGLTDDEQWAPIIAALFAGRPDPDVGAPTGDYAAQLYDSLPHGMITSIVDVVACTRTGSLVRHTIASLPKHAGEWEMLLGNFEDGRFAWALDDRLPLDEPVPARRQRRLWTIDDEAALKIALQLSEREGRSVTRIKALAALPEPILSEATRILRARRGDEPKKPTTVEASVAQRVLAIDIPSRIDHARAAAGELAEDRREEMSE